MCIFLFPDLYIHIHAYTHTGIKTYVPSRYIYIYIIYIYTNIYIYVEYQNIHIYLCTDTCIYTHMWVYPYAFVTRPASIDVPVLAQSRRKFPSPRSHRRPSSLRWPSWPDSMASRSSQMVASRAQAGPPQKQALWKPLLGTATMFCRQL